MKRMQGSQRNWMKYETEKRLEFTDGMKVT